MKSIVLGLALLGATVMPSFAANDEFLSFTDGVTTCNIAVSLGTATPDAGCGTLTIKYNTITPGDHHGQITVNGDFGQYQLSLTANGYQFAGYPEVQDFDQSDVKNVGTGAGTFTSSFTDFNNPLPVAQFSITANVNSVTSAGNVDFSQQQNGTDLYPGFNLSATPLGQNAFSVASLGTPAGTLTIGQQLHFTKAGKIATSYALSITDAGVPEPASIVLTGSMLLLAGIGLRRKVRRG